MNLKIISDTSLKLLIYSLWSKITQISHFWTGMKYWFFQNLFLQTMYISNIARLVMAFDYNLHMQMYVIIQVGKSPVHLFQKIISDPQILSLHCSALSELPSNRCNLLKISQILETSIQNFLRQDFFLFIQDTDLSSKDQMDRAFLCRLAQK